MLLLLVLLPSVKFREIPWLIFCLFFLLWLLLISVKFRVNPWQMLLPLLGLISLANLLLSCLTVNLKWEEWVKYYVFR